MRRRPCLAKNHPTHYTTPQIPRHLFWDVGFAKKHFDKKHTTLYLYIQLARIRTALSFSSISQPRLHQFQLYYICGHYVEEVLRIANQPQLAKFGLFWAKLRHFQRFTCILNKLEYHQKFEATVTWGGPSTRDPAWYLASCILIICSILLLIK